MQDLITRTLRQGPLARQMVMSLSLIVLLVMVCSQSLITWLTLTNAIHRVDERANLIMATMRGVREFTIRDIEPVITPANEDSLIFQAIGIPSHVATSVFTYTSHLDASFRDYSYREPVLNPTNPRDQANARERKIIEAFRTDPSLKSLSGSYLSPDGQMFYSALPLQVSSVSCLRCHSSPENAPPSQLRTYGRRGGFGWKLQEIVGMQIVSVPMASVQRAVRGTMAAATVITLLALVVVAVLTSLLLDRVLLCPLRQISVKAVEASLEPEAVTFNEQSRRDEIGTLAASLERLRRSLTIAMRMLKVHNQQDGHS